MKKFHETHLEKTEKKKRLEFSFFFSYRFLQKIQFIYEIQLDVHSNQI